MSAPTDLVQGLRASTADLLLALADEHWSDADLGAPCALPGWTRGHLLTHLARNADGVAGTLAGALRGEVVRQYPGGREQRDDDIEAGRTRPLAAQLADLRDACDKLDRVLGAVTDAEAWDAPAADGLAAHEWLPRRWLEVEVHRVDLGLGWTPDRWPPAFVAALLPSVVTSLDGRAEHPLHVVVDPATSVSAAAGEWRTGGAGDPIEVRGPDWAVLAWLLGRDVAGALGDAAPVLAPWR